MNHVAFTATKLFVCGALVLPVIGFAQSDCGMITSISPFTGELETVAIENCADPFEPNRDVPADFELTIDGVSVDVTTDTFVIPGETFSAVSVGLTPGSGSRFGYGVQVYQKDGDNYTQVDFSPPSREDISLDEGVAILEDYFSDDPDLSLYREVFLGTTSYFDLDFPEQQNTYAEFEFTFLPAFLEEEFGPKAPLGEYWFVFTESVVCAVLSSQSQSWIEQAQQWLIPTAHAQSVNPCGPAYTPERFVMQLEVVQIDLEPLGASSVLFLPGIQASRLYAGEDIVLPGLPNNIEEGDKLWEQTNDKRIAVLAMDGTGSSVYDIYTEDVVEEVTGRFFGANIYKGFLGLLEDMKTESNVIADYAPFAYDWRYSVFTVATEPVQYKDETKLLKDEVLRLAAESYTGKVTIVAHSNGGLVAKALLHEYGETELAGKVDKLIMIGTPQLGTPKGIGALLHGQVMEGFGDVLTRDAVLRDTILNMPGTYTLLPSSRYFDEVAEDSVVQVAEGFDLSVYDGVSTRTELTALLLDAEGVVEPDPTPQEPLELNDALLTNALAEQAILDTWQPPDGVEVIEIVGTGIPTPAEIHYEKVQTVACPSAGAVFLPAPCLVSQDLKPKLVMTNKGDKTVVQGSAQGQLGDKRTLTVNLVEEGRQRFVLQREHADLTESQAVQTFLESAIQYPYLTDSLSITDYSEFFSGFLIYAAHSPVTLRVTTPDGSIVGVVDGVISEEVPGAQVLKLAGSTYIIIPEEVDDYTLEVIGTGNGVYTLETSSLSAEDVQSVLTSFVASTTDTMMATMEVRAGIMGDLQTDFDADGVVDEVRTAAGELVLESRVQEPENIIDRPTSAGSSATRVEGRSPQPRVLGVDVESQSEKASEYQSVQTLVTDIQRILTEYELTAEQLEILSAVLTEVSTLLSK